LPLKVLANHLGQEEIDHGLQLTLFFRRPSPYRDGGGNGLRCPPAKATRLQVETGAFGGGGIVPVV
jgi:hypothetical protein